MRVAFWLLLLLACGFALTLPVGVDYPFYEERWELVLDGGNPWSTPTERHIERRVSLGGPHTFRGMLYHGPVFGFLALPYALHPLLPRLLFTLATFLTGAAAWRRLEAVGGMSRGERLAIFAFFFSNPLFWVNSTLGLFDSLVALCCVAAFLLFERGRDATVGVLLALGALLRFTPAFFLPFLVLDAHRRVRWRLVLGFGSTALVGLLVSWALWGVPEREAGFFAPPNPGSTFLSIFRFLRGTYSPLRIVMDEPDVDFLSMPLMLLAFSAFFVYAMWTRMPALLGGIIGFYIVLICFQNGEPRYAAPLFFLVPLWAYTAFEKRRDRVRAALVGSLPLLFYLLVASAWLLSQVFPYDLSWWPEILGLPTFALASYTIVRLIGWGRSSGLDSPPAG